MKLLLAFVFKLDTVAIVGKHVDHSVGVDHPEQDIPRNHSYH